ncbi:MAG: gas vesicle protein [Planctomycetota bacterium]|nr:gas vesicle protein [Planctomycetota bacterium]
MEPELPQSYRRATLVDLLDRVLDRGLFLRADIVIAVAGIPLIGATLSLAVAGTDTMLKYGILSDWDEAIRAVPPPQRQSLLAEPSGTRTA